MGFEHNELESINVQYWLQCPDLENSVEEQFCDSGMRILFSRPSNGPKASSTVSTSNQPLSGILGISTLSKFKSSMNVGNYPSAVSWPLVAVKCDIDTWNTNREIACWSVRAQRNSPSFLSLNSHVEFDNQAILHSSS